MFDEHSYMRAVGQCLNLAKERGAQYNIEDMPMEGYFPFGAISYAQMLWIKVRRMVVQLRSGQDCQDSLDDLINYAIYMKMAEMDKEAKL